jgi:hypothetical protein
MNKYILDENTARIFDLAEALEKQWEYGSIDGGVENDLKILDLAIKIYRAEQEDSFQFNLNTHLTNITDTLDKIASKLK